MAAPAPAPVPPKSDVLLRLFRERAGRPLRVLAPMVDQSELPFRMLARRYGADLCFTPMIHARMTLESPGYLDKHFSTHADDRPLVAQFCGNDPEMLLQAARRVQDRVDAVDLNLGCPQGIARRGNYGAFLLPVEPATEAAKTALLVRIVSTLHAGLSVPVTCKIRVLSSFDATLRLVLALQAAGCAVLTVHGRVRDCLKERVGATDWETIRRLRAHPAVAMPIIANGGVACFDDVAACASATGADGIMTSEAILENPGLLSDRVCTTGGAGESAGAACPPVGAVANSLQLAAQYCDLAVAYPGADLGCARAHLIKMLFGPLDAFTDLRDQLVASKGSLQQCREVVARVAERYAQRCTPLPWPLPAPPAGWTLDGASRGAASRGVAHAPPPTGVAPGASALPLPTNDALDVAAAAAEAELTARLVAACSGSGSSGGGGCEGDANAVAATSDASSSSGGGDSCSAQGDGGGSASSPVDATSAAAADGAPSSGGGSGGSLRQLARLLLAWSALRAEHPAVGLAHPAFAFDVAIPGLWYMRYRRGVLGLAPKLSAKQQQTTKQLLEGSSGNSLGTQRRLEAGDAAAAGGGGGGGGGGAGSAMPADAAAAAAVAAAAAPGYLCHVAAPLPPPPTPPARAPLPVVALSHESLRSIVAAYRASQAAPTPATPAAEKRLAHAAATAAGVASGSHKQAQAAGVIGAPAAAAAAAAHGVEEPPSSPSDAARQPLGKRARVDDVSSAGVAVESAAAAARAVSSCPGVER